jgi:GNAT superfamily N-acetyltransferase
VVQDSPAEGLGAAGPFEVIDVDRARSDEAAEVLARAFVGYPTMRWVCASDRPGFERRLEAVYRVAMALQHTEAQPALGVLAEGRLAAVALVHDPGRKLTMQSALVGLLRSVFSPARSTMRRGRRYEIAVDRLRPSAPHHFVSVIGVRPELQRLGYGRALMAVIHERAGGHPRSAGVCLDTSDPNNVPYYESLGYRVTGRAQIGPVDQAVLFRPR